MRHIIRRTLVIYAGLIVTLLIMASCGGGRSTGPSHVGTYVGTADTILTGGGRSTRVRGSIQFAVSADNTVSVSDPGGPPFGTGTLDGDSFVVSAPGSTFNSPGVSCSGSVSFDGTISDATMNGTISSSGLRCNGVPFSLTGTFTATRQSAAQKVGGGIIQALRDAVRSH